MIITLCAVVSCFGHATRQYFVHMIGMHNVYKIALFNSLAPRRCGCNDEVVIFKVISVINILNIALRECHKTSLVIS